MFSYEPKRFKKLFIQSLVYHFIKKPMLKYLYSFFLCTLSLIGYGQDTTKVLFIGNSYTYFWNLPQLVAELGSSDEHILWTRQSTAGGTNLAEHWRHEKGLKSQKILESDNWDIVVIQDHSLRAINEVDSLNYYMKLWIDKIKNQGATPLLYMTWAREYDPTMIDQISSAYEHVAVENDVAIVPVGRIWQLTRTLRPDIALYDADQSHPSTLGTYLSACTFFNVLMDKKSTGLPSRITSIDEHGEKLYLMIVPPEDAQFCQSVADKFLTTYGKD